MANKIIYEQPLSEKVRTYLRLAHLFKTADYHLDGEAEWGSHKTLITLLAITDIMSRIDIKTELIKDLEKYTSTLLKLEQNPGVDHGRLNAFLGEINKLLEHLKSNQCQPGQQLRNDELARSLRQRANISGDICDFDLPRFHFWINQEAAIRKKNLRDWSADLKIIKKSVQLFLLVLRNSANPSNKKAKAGFYQELIEVERIYQMVRILLNRKSKYYPEISGGKHRFSIRFMEQADTQCRSTQTSDDVEFELHCCAL